MQFTIKQDRLFPKALLIRSRLQEHLTKDMMKQRCLPRHLLTWNGTNFQQPTKYRMQMNLKSRHFIKQVWTYHKCLHVTAPAIFCIYGAMVMQQVIMLTHGPKYWKKTLIHGLKRMEG